MDNLNTHRIASLYEAFPPEEARRLAEHLEIHYTPNHGSWLNMSEIELNALKGQGLNDRIRQRKGAGRSGTLAASSKQQNTKNRLAVHGSRCTD
ncbi:MAG: transposase [Desulfofustis sp. PB-SRB1]|nr:transposase [Desulfofustis sp. PB-SRB1]MBM1004008.1 transposase [Desulfofustis sp. PB-SRB1]